MLQKLRGFGHLPVQPPFRLAVALQRRLVVRVDFEDVLQARFPEPNALPVEVPHDQPEMQSG